MSPRTYSMEVRAEQAADTGERILDAATALYRKQGIGSTSLREVARDAGVARTTVLNHFGTTHLLAQAVLGRITENLRVPDEHIFDGARTAAERTRRLVAALFAFYDRSTPWFELFRGEYESVPALRAGERRFWRDIEHLYGQALGLSTTDARLKRTLHGLTHPATLGAMREVGFGATEAAEVVGDIAAGLLRVPARRSGRK